MNNRPRGPGGGDLAQLIPELLILAIAGGLSPTHVLAVIVLLETPRPILNAGAFVMGLSLVRLVIATIALLVLNSISWSPKENDSTTAILSLFIGVLLLGAAIALELRKLSHHVSSPRWESVLKAATPAKAFLAGLGIMLISPRHWLIVIVGAFAIEDSGIGPISEALMVVVYIALLELLVWAPLAAYIASPVRTSGLLSRLRSGYAHYSRPVMIGVSDVLGIVLTLGGLMRLAG
jgi:hypothetical protein